MREVTPPLPAGDQIDSPRLVLRDGTVASVRPSAPADREEIRRFFHHRAATAASLARMVAPSAVAVIGVSRHTCRRERTSPLLPCQRLPCYPRWTTARRRG